MRCAMDHEPNSSRVRDRNFRAVCRCGWTSLISISLGRLAQITMFLGFRQWCALCVAPALRQETIWPILLFYARVTVQASDINVGRISQIGGQIFLHEFAHGFSRR